MSIALGDFIILLMIFFSIALLYASVGFGGGSSYLAILALFASSFFLIRSTALLCNILVVSGSCILFYKKGLLQFKKFLPFILTSVPFAFIGASFKLNQNVFFSILGLTLMAAAIALLIQTVQLKSKIEISKYPKYVPYLLGACIGLLSGMVGIGGGIFLAPLLNQMKWDKPISIAALASFFILVNSLSGLAGLLFSGTFELLWPEILGLLAAVVIGGQIGVRLSLGKISAKGIRLLTAFLVFFVGVRVLINNGLQISLFS